MGRDQLDEATMNSYSTMYTAIDNLTGESEEVGWATPASTQPNSESSQYAPKPPKSAQNTIPEEENAAENDSQQHHAGDKTPEDASSDDNSDGMIDVEYVLNPRFPDLPSSVPLTYTLAMHACLSAELQDRPTFAQVRKPFASHSVFLRLNA